MSRAAANIRLVVGAFATVLLVAGCSTHPPSGPGGTASSDPASVDAASSAGHPDVVATSMASEPNRTAGTDRDPLLPIGSTLPGTPIIKDFTITPTDILCDGSRPVATMSWQVSPADAGIEFWLDGLGQGTPQAGYAAAMSNQPLPVNFACDGQPHTITLVAHGPGGAFAQRSIEVTTRF
ncbi:MAG: hypothetical protein N2037_13730 [Acidimicrobiales bacterium]|nr:hypothetical protein [Acidimicrobiales bacterium]